MEEYNQQLYEEDEKQSSILSLLSQKKMTLFLFLSTKLYVFRTECIIHKQYESRESLLETVVCYRKAKGHTYIDH